MKILIVGMPKSGSTVLTYRIAASLEDCYIDFEPHGPRDRSTTNGKKNVVTKRLFGQGSNIADYKDYDKKIWLTRDPRDFLVSQVLYKWYRNPAAQEITKRDRNSFLEFKKLLAKKIEDPSSVSIRELRDNDSDGKILALEEALQIHKKIHGFLGLKKGWHVFKYEDMIDGNYQALNSFLGFEIKEDAEVDPLLQRVSRKGSYGDWRNWLTPQDTAQYKRILSEAIEKTGYDNNDWTLNNQQTIYKKYSLDYVEKLFSGGL